MPIDERALMRVLAKLAEEEKLRVCVKESVKGGAIVGGSAMAGAMILGPVGLALGGAVGGICAAWSAHGKFQPVHVVLLNLDARKQRLLINELQNAFRNVNVTDLKLFLPLLNGSASAQEMVIFVIKEFLQNELKMALA